MSGQHDVRASAVGIEAGASTLTVAQDSLTGTLLLAEECTAEYDVTFFSGG